MENPKRYLFSIKPDGQAAEEGGEEHTSVVYPVKASCPDALNKIGNTGQKGDKGENGHDNVQLFHFLPPLFTKRERPFITMDAITRNHSDLVMAGTTSISALQSPKDT